jgi:hypothetical protein
MKIIKLFEIIELSFSEVFPFLMDPIIDISMSVKNFFAEKENKHPTKLDSTTKGKMMLLLNI